MQQEWRQRAAGLGQVQRALQGAPCGGRVAERVPGDRLQQESVRQPGLRGYVNRALQDRRKRGGRRVRVVLAEPQRRCGDAYLARLAVLIAEAHEDLLGTLGFAE